MGDYWEQVKLRDPYIFRKAEDFFNDIDNTGSPGLRQPNKISYRDEDQLLPDNKANPATSHGRVFRFNDGALILIQFMRPRVWRIQFDPKASSGSQYSDINSRTIIEDTLSKLIDTLDAVEKITWAVELITDHQHYILQSVRDPNGPNRKVEVQLWIRRNPFQITAVRALATLPPAEKIPELQVLGSAKVKQLELQTSDGGTRAIIWKTKPRGLQYRDSATLITVEKSITADYIGFGEQGGKNLFKKKTYMNYFNFDNMRYQNVYGRGPLDDREPLYHSEPYFLEVDSLPGYKSQLATFIDNYSHICIDLGMSDQTAIRMATRFNAFHGIFVAGDSIQEVIQLYTSIVGKPRLKPRYVLGYHQGCYGYDNEGMVLDCINQYRACGFPIDGMHIDVDIQDDYRTFTIDTRPGHFPNPKDMFAKLRQLGVKCSTNITPYINCIPSPSYTTLNEGLANNYFLVDKRDRDPSAPNAQDQRYLEYGTGNTYFTVPIRDKPQYFEADDYDFGQVFDSGKPFHGGVFYGWENGHPGHYPNLNKFEIRKWWGKQYQYLYECGLDFVWQDMTSPCIAEQYGDMKSLPFRLLLDSDSKKSDPNAAEKKRAIEIWSLYSYNLHKATYHGLNRVDQLSADLKWRENRRNFIIGRGSYVGSHRYAGLWTGDNASTWEFLKISVAQVLALSLSGITISGADVGGFEFIPAERDYPNPELIIRWYCAYSLLPWFRNHYTKYRNWMDGPRQGQMRKDGKLFQEPYAYQQHYEQHQDRFQGREGEVYRAVLKTCRYFVRLRYSLMQLLYDAMFENMLTGLPIARAMNQRYTRSQYMVRNDLLVAPALDKDGNDKHKIYLPFPDSWFSMNLRPDEPLGTALLPRVNGGSRLRYNCLVSDQDNQIPFTCPMYIREGAIIPKIEVRDYVPDPTLTKQPPNPITLHVYPGKDNEYDMYLDDGISRDSAPGHEYVPETYAGHGYGTAHTMIGGLVDPKAKSRFCQVKISQETTRNAADDESANLRVSRRLTIRAHWNKYQGSLEELIGQNYTVVFWHEPDTPLESITVTSDKDLSHETDISKKTTVVTVPISLAHTQAGVTVYLDYEYSFS
ncbi:Alpha-glucosidase 2 [Madurella mycetomatis]|uniref:alpha-glucosidase n=1 Tax=Madurella mycetomatis TaxID=100816 RepID=A0A175VQS7_9PEZI|nr:Alpha-glucosidase 2 [Madurella mycetomatis]